MTHMRIKIGALVGSLVATVIATSTVAENKTVYCHCRTCNSVTCDHVQAVQNKLRPSMLRRGDQRRYSVIIDAKTRDFAVIGSRGIER